MNKEKRKYRIYYNRIEYPKELVTAIKDKLALMGFGEGYLNCPEKHPDQSIKDKLPVSGKTILCLFDKSGHMITPRSIIKVMLWVKHTEAYIQLVKKIGDYTLYEYRDFTIKGKNLTEDKSTKYSFSYDTVKFCNDIKDNLSKKLDSIGFDKSYLEKPNNPKVAKYKDVLPISGPSMVRVFRKKGRMITSSSIIEIMMWTNTHICDVELIKKMKGNVVLKEKRTYLIEKNK